MGDKFTMSTGQAHELAMALARNGWTAEDVKKLCAGDFLAQVLATLRGTSGTVGKPAAGVYPVVIDYAKTVEQMKKDGRYDWSNDNINDTNFNINDTDQATVAFELVHLNTMVSSKQVLVYMKTNDLRPATLAETLAFGATYPDIQRDFPVVCLGSSWVDPGGFRRVPCLRGGGSGRELYLFWFGSDWHARCRFLAVRKTAADNTPAKHVIDTSADPFIPNGFRVEEHRKTGVLTWDPTKVNLFLSPRQQGGQVINGYAIRKELKNQPVLNACVLDYLFKHPELIPEDWKGKYVYFWGTIYRDGVDCLCVRFLYWNDGRWDWYYRWLNDGWNSFRPAVAASV